MFTHSPNSPVQIIYSPAPSISMKMFGYQNYQYLCFYPFQAARLKPYNQLTVEPYNIGEPLVHFYQIL